MFAIILDRVTPRFPRPTVVLAPANHLLDDAAARTAALEQQGCLLLRDVLDKEAIDEARVDLARRLQRQGVVTPGDDQPNWSGASVANVDPFALHEDDPPFVRLALGEQLRSVLQRVHGSEVHLYKSVQIRFALPDDDRHTIPAHQDARYIAPDSAFWAFWIPLIDIPVGDGGLAVVLGSHHGGMREHPLSQEYFSYYMGEERPQRCIPLDDIRDEWATASFRAGDLLVFHSFVVHSALPNRSRFVRLSIDGRYQRADRPLVNWQARYSVLEGTRRRQRVLELLPEPDALDADVRESVIAHMLVEDRPLERAVVLEALATASAATASAVRPGT